MRTTAPHRCQIHSHLGGQLLGAGTGHHPAITDDWSSHHWSSSHRGRSYRSRSYRSSRHWRSGCRSYCCGWGRGCWCWSIGFGVSDLSFCFHNQTDGFPHRCRAASWHQNSCQKAILKRLHIHVGFIRLHHQDRFPTGDLLARLFQPLDDLALRHGGAKSRHEDVVGRH